MQHSSTGFREKTMSSDPSLDLLLSDGLLRQVGLPRHSNLSFEVEGVPFYACYDPDGQGLRLRIWAALCTMPFTAESVPRRRALTAILSATCDLPTARFGLNDENQIIVSGTFCDQNLQPPAFIFVGLTALLQEALPFIRLIGAYL